MADIVGLVALSLSCLNGCVKGLIILSKARHYNRDISDIRLRTELTLHSLTTWAEEAGLMEDPPRLLVSANDAPLVPKILGQLETLLLDLRQLQQRYGLYLEPTSETVEALHDDDTTFTDRRPQQHEYTKRAVAIFRRRKEPWKRLRWVTLDDDKFGGLLDKVKSYISEIEKFLEQAKQQRRDKNLEFCLRDAILNASGQQELDIIGMEYGEAISNLAIAAAARLKQTRLKLGGSYTATTPLTGPLYETASDCSRYERRDSTFSSSSDVKLRYMKLSMRLLTLSRTARAQPFRTLAQYDSRLVLLEWKNVANMKDLTISKRVNQVATLLQDLGPSFHSLKCLGFVEDHVAKRYGYIFDLPDQLHASWYNSPPTAPIINDLQPAPELRSLRQVLDQNRTPSLNMRLSLSVVLVENLLNLHTSGWLHKAFRSDNVLLVRDANHNDESLAEELSAYAVYIAGYIHSRADSPGELTEPLKSELEADLYRHPRMLGNARQPYHKSLDIFAIGCTLLEIGLWSSLQQIFEYHSTILSDTSATSSLPMRSMPDPTLYGTLHSVKPTMPDKGATKRSLSTF